MLVRITVAIVARLHSVKTSSFADGEYRSAPSTLSVAPNCAEEAEARRLFDLLPGFFWRAIRLLMP